MRRIESKFNIDKIIFFHHPPIRIERKKPFPVCSAFCRVGIFCLAIPNKSITLLPRNINIPNMLSVMIIEKIFDFLNISWRRRQSNLQGCHTLARFLTQRTKTRVWRALRIWKWTRRTRIKIKKGTMKTTSWKLTRHL